MTIQIDRGIISQVQHAKFLGVIFEKKMKQKYHITEIIGKVARALNLIKAMTTDKWGAHPTTILKVYKGLVRPILEWGHLDYMDACQTDLNKLDFFKNQAIRVCTGLNKNTHRFSLHKVTNIPPLKTRRNFIARKYFLKYIF